MKSLSLQRELPVLLVLRTLLLIFKSDTKLGNDISYLVPPFLLSYFPLDVAIKRSNMNNFQILSLGSNC